MDKKNILLLIPLLIITGYAIYSWIIILSNRYVPHWQNFTCICGVIFLWVLFSIDYKKALLGTGLFLIAGVVQLLSLTPEIWTFTFGKLISFNLLSMGVLIIYALCNNVILVDIYLDWKEKKKDDTSHTL